MEEAGIGTHVRNKALLGVRTEVLPALCVVNDQDHARALQVLKDRVADDRMKSTTEWKCIKCGSDNPGNFEVCWSCGDAGAGGEPLS